MKNYFDFINLGTGEDDKNKVLENVRSNISFKGANLWILACAIVVASVGLNVNSTAVIIGAMLISPLMGPIVGAGFGLGIFDFNLLKRSLKNLFVATIVGLIVSTIYFYVSPFKEAQTELLARTSPNIYDILIAFFGGLVGVIAITRVEKGNPIPGVAIATALMPPLCTAGYGLAIGSYRFFFGAMYLYIINCVFICIATFLIVKYLKYPRLNIIDRRQRARVTYAMTILILVVSIPSVYFAYILFEEKKYNQKVNFYIENEFADKGYTVIFKKTRYNTTPKKVEIALLTKRFDSQEVDSLNKKLDEYGLSNTQLIIRQDTTDLKKNILNEIGSERLEVSKKDALILDLQKQVNQNQFDAEKLYNEIHVFFPEIESISISTHKFNDPAKNKAATVLIYRSKKEIANTQKLSLWLQKRLGKENVEVYRGK